MAGIIYCQKTEKSNQLRKKYAEKLAGIKLSLYFCSVKFTQ